MLVSAQLIIFALILWLAERQGRKERGISDTAWADGIIIGAAQALALAPGVSRSGITITAGLARGLQRESAARFSFLLSIPIIGGTAAYSCLGLVRHPEVLPTGSLGLFAIGMVAAIISGYLCIRFFLRYLQTRTLTPFIIYRIGLGLLLLGWFGIGRM